MNMPINLNQKLSPHFTVGEATRSDAAVRLGISNSIQPEDMEAVLFTAKKMERVRRILEDLPMFINSWYRNRQVNVAVGGVENSQHRKGEAVDFTCSQYGNPYEVCVKLQSMVKELDYDQLILEPTWVHVSFIREGRARREVLTLSGKTYLRGLIG